MGNQCRQYYGYFLVSVVTLALVGVYVDWRVNVLPQQPLYIPTATSVPVPSGNTDRRRRVVEKNAATGRQLATVPSTVPSTVPTTIAVTTTVPITKALLTTQRPSPEKAEPIVKDVIKMKKKMKMYPKSKMPASRLITADQLRKQKLAAKNKQVNDSGGLTQTNRTAVRNRTVRNRPRMATTVTSKGEYLYFKTCFGQSSTTTKVEKQAFDIMNMVS